jgi:GNAT superfamily N-acetyltransferase
VRKRVAEFIIRPVVPQDEEWISQLMADHWGSDTVVVHDTVYKPADLPGFIAVRGQEPVGLATYHVEMNECELVTLDSLLPSAGVGSALVDHVRGVAEEAGCQRLWVITTNDNLDALRFYQRYGFSLVAVHRDGVTKSRQKKPQIPEVGYHGIPIRDEIELEMTLK